MSGQMLPRAFQEWFLSSGEWLQDLSNPSFQPVDDCKGFQFIRHVPCRDCYKMGHMEGNEHCQRELEWKLCFIWSPEFCVGSDTSWGSALPLYIPRSGKNSPFGLVLFVSTCLCTLKLVTGSVCWVR